MEIEKLATAAVKRSISMTDVLSEFVNDGDKEPSWDGNIYIYAQKTKRKEGIKKVPVQVKGVVREKRQEQKAFSYSVSIVDLDNWLNDGGVLLFVVALSKDGIESDIYYAALTPVYIRNLKKASRAKKNLSVPVKLFPQENNEKVTVVLNFYEHRKKQASFATAPLLTKEELEKEGVLESVSLSATAYGKADGMEAERVLLSGDVYLYANLKGGVVPQPLLEKPTDIRIIREVVGVVSSKGEQLYASYQVIRDEVGVTVQLGKSIRIICDECEKGKLEYRPQGFLSDFIRDTKCFIAIVQNGELSIDGKTTGFTGMEKVDVNRLRAKLTYYCEVQEMLNILGVKKELNPAEMSGRDENSIKVFTDALVHGNKVVIANQSDNCIYGRYRLANLSVLVWVTRDGDGYRLRSFFDKKRILLNLCVGKHEDATTSYAISHYALMKKKDFLETDNLDLSRIRDDINTNDNDMPVIEELILFMLEILKAYDESPQEKGLIDLADFYCTWIENNTKQTNNMMRLNRLQITKRKRELSSEEIAELFELRKPEYDPGVRCGANLLLGKNDSAQDCFDELSPNEKKMFKSFPICHFGNLT